MINFNQPQSNVIHRLVAKRDSTERLVNFENNLSNQDLYREKNPQH